MLTFWEFTSRSFGTYQSRESDLLSTGLPNSRFAKSRWALSFGILPRSWITATYPPSDGRSSLFHDFNCDLRPPVTQILCQLESPVSEIPMDSRSPPRVLHGWMVQIYIGTFTMECPDLLSSGLPESRTPNPRYRLLSRDFRPCSRGLNPHASPNRSNDCRVF
jgi:hypothetical protein